MTHLGQSASRRESAILPQRLPDERVLRHELVRTDERVERPRCVLSPDVDNVDVHHALVHLVERCLEGLRRQTRKSRRGGGQSTWEPPVLEQQYTTVYQLHTA